ncbi:MAG: hypothetical protein JWN29_3485 [Acidimicrobiales bacterium]|nr:hypothetical protein [Acidimicrobiales bacterium]
MRRVRGPQEDDWEQVPVERRQGQLLLLLPRQGAGRVRGQRSLGSPTRRPDPRPRVHGERPADGRGGGRGARRPGRDCRKILHGPALSSTGAENRANRGVPWTSSTDPYREASASYPGSDFPAAGPLAEGGFFAARLRFCRSKIWSPFAGEGAENRRRSGPPPPSPSPATSPDPVASSARRPPAPGGRAPSTAGGRWWPRRSAPGRRLLALVVLALGRPPQ